MLHENPQMLDIDVDHWRNLQDLFLESAKEKRRIIVIHEAGEVLKLVSDCPGVRGDIATWAEATHLELVSTAGTGAGAFEFYLRKL